MKKITEYLTKYKYDDIDNIIISECNIDLYSKTPYFEFNNNLYESLGIFNGCKEITEYIFKKLKNNLNDTELLIDISKLNCNNKFFKECYLHINYNSKYIEGEAGYISSDGHEDYNEIRYDSENKIFKFIEIIIYLDKDHIDNIYSLIMHELIHAYDDYIHIKKSGFDYSLYNRSKKQNSNIISKHNEDESLIETVCKDILYRLFKDEQTAYIGQLNGELKNKEYKDIKDVIKDLSETNIYWNYKQIYINYHNILKSKKYIEQFCNIYRKLNNTSKSNESIIKELNNRFNKFWKKFINHIYQIANDKIIKEHIIDTNKKVINL